MLLAQHDRHGPGARRQQRPRRRAAGLPQQPAVRAGGPVHVLRRADLREHGAARGPHGGRHARRHPQRRWPARRAPAARVRRPAPVLLPLRQEPQGPSRLLRSSIPGLAPPQPTGAAHLTPHLLLYNSTHTRPRPLARVEQVPGSYLGGDELVCVTPPLTRGGTAVQVLLPLSSGGSGRPCRC